MSAAASTSIFGTLGSFLIVGALWGCTNPLLKLGSARVPEIQHDSAIKQFFCQLIATLTAWRFLVPFLLNQSGSIVYVYLLGSSDITMAVPICNSLTFVFTALTSRYLGEKPKQPMYTYTGMTVVLIGIAICFLGKSQDLL